MTTSEIHAKVFKALVAHRPAHFVDARCAHLATEKRTGFGLSDDIGMI